MRIVLASNHKITPWKNGGGTTTEIAVHPPGAGIDEFLWRLSMARVESDGPFSTFDGVDRTLSILDGDGIRLTVDSVAVDLTAGSAPFAFAGDVPTAATLIGGPVTDLNVMTRRAVLRHRVWRLVWPVDVKPAAVTLVFAPSGGCAVARADERFELGVGDTAIAEGEAIRVIPRIDAPVFLIEILQAG